MAIWTVRSSLLDLVKPQRCNFGNTKIDQLLLVSNFSVQRHDIITQFKPEAYWVLKVECEGAGRTLKLDWSRERIFDHDIAQIFLNRVKSADKLTVEDLSKLFCLCN